MSGFRILLVGAIGIECRNDDALSMEDRTMTILPAPIDR
jgi:hypothetical protein